MNTEMTIDLSQFVDKEVYIRFRNGTRKEVKLQKTMGDDGYPFYYYDQSQFFYYSQSGHYWHHPSPGPNDIVDIIENHQAKPMTIDLSQFVDKEVHITLRNGQEFVTDVEKIYAGGYYYYIHNPITNDILSYDQEGHYSVRYREAERKLDIIKIKLRNPEPMTESLKCETLKGITKSLLPELIPFVESHEKYAEVMYQLFDEFLTDKFGDMKPEVKGEIACMFMDSLAFRSV